MVKGKDLVPFIPPTEEEIMLIQPNNVTKNCHVTYLISLMLLSDAMKLEEETIKQKS